MKYNIVCVGNLKEKYWASACEEYQKRLGKFGQVSIIEVEEEKLTSDRPSEIEKVKQAEGKRILAKLSGYVVLCELTGTMLSSEKLAEKIEQIKQNSSNITFVIGGSYGVSEEVKQSADYALCFSPMTFPHQLMRVMLLEQIYRAETITHHITYHK